MQLAIKTFHSEGMKAVKNQSAWLVNILRRLNRGRR